MSSYYLPPFLICVIIHIVSNAKKRRDSFKSLY
nr:MAG TPA_asm: hypothetical protein [Caudoviricetes sp.]